MHPADIKAALQKRGSSPAKISRSLGVSSATVSLVLNGRGTSRRVADEIAKQTGRSVTQLFPGKYEAERRFA